MKTAALLLSLLTLGSVAAAQTVALSGMLGGKALVIVDGSAPKSVAVGESYRGVKIVSTQGDQAVMEIAGKRHTLRVGEAPASVGGASGSVANRGPSGTKIVLNASSGGHFFTQGQINGRAVQLVVDTGATMVSLSVGDAERVGLNYKAGQAVQMSTANGVIPGWRLKLASVRVGDVVVYDVDAIVSSGAMPYVLLGNSFLTHFQMTRTNDQMVLDKRY
ncbi:TIGR02281 family clan AA aspartic protease [Rhodoferax sp.]|uniref:retropepsin-like aspartic protease family protein n=1 Tax=Rhodoferax sp. TaxID=50421 RepID=UPI0025F44BF7|nr:TIGR02281 family clan AA aspartic protease [Rhodoferax sp.]